MTPDRWKQVEELYHAALAKEPAQRSAFLAGAAHDEELRREVESLLAYDCSAANSLLDAPAWQGRGGIAIGTTTRASCPACRTLVTPGQRFCSSCGAPLIVPAEASTLSLQPPRAAASSKRPRFPPGTILAQRYRIVSLLGSGGIGEVYRADDLLLGQTVALKFLPSWATSDEAALSRFRSEVRIARQLSHPNVCRVYDIGEAEGLTYLTMEYVDGEDLASLLRRIGKLSHDKALEVARKLCAGLAAAHEKGIVHRDLKPANIMLDGQGKVRITDFGLAAVADQVTDIGSGTPAYMAPEQRAGKEVTPRSDIYALGIVLHELFTGKRPSRDNKSTELDPIVEHATRYAVICRSGAAWRRPARRCSSGRRDALARPGGELGNGRRLALTDGVSLPGGNACRVHSTGFLATERGPDQCHSDGTLAGSAGGKGARDRKILRIPAAASGRCIRVGVQCGLPSLSRRDEECTVSPGCHHEQPSASSVFLVPREPTATGISFGWMGHAV
jgi:predicted Ser/Thr protein kinase